MTTKQVTTNGAKAGKGVVQVPSSSIEIISLPRPKLERMVLKVVGVSPLIMHKWSDKAIKMIEDKQQKKAQKGREAKDPKAEYEAAIHRDKDGDYAFPSIGFKAAAITAVSQIQGVTKVMMRGAFHVEGEYVKIHGEPKMRTDMVRIAMGTADVRYRPEFTEWSADIPIIYNAGVISREQVLNLFQTAGFAVGIGEWRPEKDGSYGMFRLAEDNE